MKKRTLALTVILALMLSICASAATPRYNVVNRCELSLTFDNRTANCRATVKVVDLDADIDLTLTLYNAENGRALASWAITSIGTTTQTYPVISGNTYTLTLTGTVSGDGGTDSIDLSTTVQCS